MTDEHKNRWRHIIDEENGDDGLHKKVAVGKKNEKHNTITVGFRK